ncbi:ribosome maturation factor RimM [Candidatus Izemoplasma sp. B36]|uniref:ribosome maturation factor RimM n=1 Tax=Candidatus Izemoplasma sp. B36 TaxID=3242468 RepID=UPI0035576D2F
MEYLKIGKILNTRGIKGELKIKPLTDFQEDRYKQGNKVYILFKNKYLEFEVKKYRNIKNMDILVFKDNEDINLIEKYKGSYIYVLADSYITLYENEYHLSEIIDLDVYQKSNLIGKVYDVKSYPQGDYLDILLNNDKHALIPFRDEFVTDVNLEKAYIEVVEMEGLI